MSLISKHRKRSIAFIPMFPRTISFLFFFFFTQTNSCSFDWIEDLANNKKIKNKKQSKQTSPINPQIESCCLWDQLSGGWSANKEMNLTTAAVESLNKLSEVLSSGVFLQFDPFDLRQFTHRDIIIITLFKTSHHCRWDVETPEIYFGVARFHLVTYFGVSIEDVLSRKGRTFVDIWIITS